MQNSPVLIHLTATWSHRFTINPYETPLSSSRKKQEGLKILDLNTWCVRHCIWPWGDETQIQKQRTKMTQLNGLVRKMIQLGFKEHAHFFFFFFFFFNRTSDLSCLNMIFKHISKDNSFSSSGRFVWVLRLKVTPTGILNSSIFMDILPSIQAKR